MGFYQEIISMFIIYWVPVLYILDGAILHTSGQNLGPKFGAKIWGQNLMGFYQEIISNVHQLCLST
jgi:hypothetical protein